MCAKKRKIGIKITGNIPNFLTSPSVTDLHAFKLSSQDLIFLTTPIDEANNEDKVLLGVMLKLRYLDDQDVSSLCGFDFHQLYFKPNIAVGNPLSLHPPRANEDLSISSLLSIGWNKMYRIHRTTALTTGEIISNSVIERNDEHSGPRNEEIPFKLDFFGSKKVDLIFFPKDELVFMSKMFSEVIFSGCKFNYGHYLGLNGEGEATINEEFFTLKLEGHALQTNTLRTEEDIFSEEVGPGVILGRPCPPWWKFFNVVATAIIENNPDISYFSLRSLQNNFEKHLRTLGATYEVKNDNS